jgi:pectin methylesterase-like acyl-CoA thioesterase
MTEDIQITAAYAEADIIAGWDFYKAGSSGRKADFAAQDNDADALNLINTESGDVSGWLDKSTLGGGGYESFKGAAVNWRTGASNGDVGNWHWQTKINAEAFTDINVQFKMLYNYNAYQKYNVEFSTDGENWTKAGDITMTGAKAEASFNETLPEAANNQKDLYIRMLADKGSSVDGAASANDGNTLAMFFITGKPKLIDDGVAPKLESTVPANGATGASATGKIVLTFDERVKVADNATATLGGLTLTPIASGKTVTFEYKGLEYSTEYTFNLPGGSIADLTDNFISETITLTFTTMTRPTVSKGLYDYVVENVDDLMAAIDAAQARTDKNVRYRIFIKNGEYTIPLSSTMKTVNGYEVPECITFINTDNVSFIGESRDGVIITNGIDKNATFASTYGTTSKYDGIGNSDVFQLRGQGYYWQDLTVETGMDDATGRDLAIHDRGTKNIYKNVGLSGYQDTWTSNNDNGLYYFEDGFVRGRTDYMCGKGDIFWNRVELRQIAGGYAAVPSKPAKYGWIYKDCVINGEGDNVDGNYTLGRPWGSGTPIALFIDTKMNVVPSSIGWNEMSGGWPSRFAEYNSMTSTGSVIDLSGRKKTFGDGHENNPVLSAEEALENSDLHRMYGDWDPTLATEQAPVPANVKQDGGELVWDNSDYALLWAVVKDGSVIGFTTEPKFALTSDGSYSVRAANEMGGLSESSAVVVIITTGISEVESNLNNGSDAIYNLNGVRVEKANKGLYIINGKKVVVK